MNSNNVTNLINALGKSDKKQAEQAAAQLTEMGPVVVPALLKTLGQHKSLFTSIPITRLFPGLEKLDTAPPKDPQARWIETILFNLGLPVIPKLVEEFGRVGLAVRHALARVLVRHAATAVGSLVDALHKLPTRATARDALAAIGEPAIDPLAGLLRSEPPGSATWDAADTALSRIMKVPTWREIRKQKQALLATWICAIVVAALFFGIGFGIGLGLWLSLAIGLVAGYICWALILTDWSSQTYAGCGGTVLFVIDMFTAPFEYRQRAAQHAQMVADREMVKQKFSLPR
jgi:hypothetical protein